MRLRAALFMTCNEIQLNKRLFVFISPNCIFSVTVSKGKKTNRFKKILEREGETSLTHCLDAFHCLPRVLLAPSHTVFYFSLSSFWMTSVVIVVADRCLFQHNPRHSRKEEWPMFPPFFPYPPRQAGSAACLCCLISRGHLNSPVRRARIKLCAEE